VLWSTSVGFCAALAVVLAPAASAGVIVFASDRCPEAYFEGCSKSLWTVEDDGRNLTRITPAASQAPPGEASFDDSPSWSPDGSSILYRRQLHNRPGHGLWIVAADGTSKSQVGPQAPNPIVDSYDSPEWSPDGRSIVFASRSDIWLMSIDGAEIKRLTQGPESDDSPTFSPDGSRIAFLRSRTEVDGTGERALLSMDLDGSDVAPVLVGTPPDPRPQLPLGYLRAAWSPDGSQFALAYREDLYTLEADGTDLQLRGQAGTPLSVGAPLSQPLWTAEPAPALIFDLPMEGQPLQRLELTGAPVPARPITLPVTDPNRPYVGGDQDPDWRASDPVTPEPDDAPPVVLPIDSGDGSAQASSARRRLSVRKRALGFMAFDPGGVRRVDAAIGRRVLAGGRKRCRYSRTGGGLGRPRACSRPVWRHVRGAAHFDRIVRGLAPGRYRLRLRAVDGLGNRTARTPAVRLRLRR
jgi:Tol biopolymer transport system component